MKWRFTSACVLVCSVTSIAPAWAASYVVATTGSDSADGSAATPWKTLQHAADTVVAGDTVTVTAGTYVGFALGFDDAKGGTAGKPIVFKGMPGAVINQANAKTTDAIDIEGGSYVTIDGFEISGVGRAGIRAVWNETSNSTDVIIQNNYSHDNAVWGIFTSHVDNLLIQNNRTSNSAQQHGIYVSNACVNPVVRANTIWGNHNSGLHMNGDVSQGGNGIIVGALVEQNVIYDNGVNGGSAIDCDGVQSSRIQNNLIYDEHASGISLFKEDAAQSAINNIVVNNTIAIASDGRWALNVQNASTGNTAYNNILLDANAGHGSIDISADSLTGFTSDYNVVTGNFTADGDDVIALAAWRTQTNQDAHSFVAASAALFVSATDYHLLATSPAIDKGTPKDAPANDLDGNTRPTGAGYDIGAYEYCTMCMMAPDAGIAPSMDAGVVMSEDGGVVPSDGGGVVMLGMDAGMLLGVDAGMVLSTDAGMVVTGRDGGSAIANSATPAKSGCGCATVGEMHTAPRWGWGILLGIGIIGRRSRRLLRASLRSTR